MRVCVCKRVGTFPTVSIPMRDQIGVSDWHKVSNKLKYYKTKLYILQMIAMKFVFTAEHTEMSHFHCIYAALHTFFIRMRRSFAHTRTHYGIRHTV